MRISRWARTFFSLVLFSGVFFTGISNASCTPKKMAAHCCCQEMTQAQSCCSEKASNFCPGVQQAPTVAATFSVANSDIVLHWTVLKLLPDSNLHDIQTAFYRQTVYISPHENLIHQSPPLRAPPVSSSSLI